MTTELDIVIPVYNEGANIVRVLESLRAHVKTSFRVLICYDHDEDDTIEALQTAALPGLELKPSVTGRDVGPASAERPAGAAGAGRVGTSSAERAPPLEVALVKNRGRGVLSAILAGFEASRAPSVLVFAADDDYNAPNLDKMVERFRDGCDIVVASRFIPGGCMKGCPWLKGALVRTSAWALHHVARVPAHDPSNGFRLFSRRVLDSIAIESKVGFAYSIELLVKCHRLGWKIGEVPVQWYERTAGQSRFRVVRWLPQYLEWFFYAFATTYLVRAAGVGPAKGRRAARRDARTMTLSGRNFLVTGGAGFIGSALVKALVRAGAGSLAR